ncbi:MAG: sensor histidine kinase [Lysobacteraceae bacterium]
MDLRSHLRNVFSPLAVAAYIGWLAVFLQAGSQLAARDPALGWAARGLMLGFLAGFVHAMVDQRKPAGAVQDWDTALMSVCAIGLVALGPAATSPILMVILAAVYGGRFRGPALVAAVGALVLAGLGLLWLRWNLSGTVLLLQWGSFASFILFAAIVLQAATRAEALAEELREANAGLLATRALLAETARDSERLRLSRELHDVAGHTLTALKLNLQVLERAAAPGATTGLAQCRELTDALLQDLRGLARQLRRHDGLDLGQALEALAAGLPRPRTRVHIDAGARAPDGERAAALLRVAQEALTNSARHGGAAQAQLHLSRDPDGLVLEVEDDGLVRLPLREGSGITGMRERLADFDGRLRLDRSPLGGLRLQARLPLGPPA